MQDIQSIGGGSRIFGGSGGDRRMRPHGHYQNQQPLKCPRCDSLNTKFCYYNNYNLSQPRHFCKGCRRYWTKGGVLRSVPVGGGCRKTKRSKPKPSSRTSAPSPAVRERRSNSHSSSESSSLTVTTTTAATEAISAPSSDFLREQEMKFVIAQNANRNFQSCGNLVEQAGSDCGIFSEIGSFTSLITSSNEALPFGFSNIGDVTPFRLSQQSHHHSYVQSEHNQWQSQKVVGVGMGTEEFRNMQEITAGFLNQTFPVDLSTLQNRSSSNMGFECLDWQGAGGGQDQLFDISNAVDQANYWSQSQWTDQDHHPGLHLP